MIDCIWISVWDRSGGVLLRFDFEASLPDLPQDTKIPRGGIAPKRLEHRS